MHLFCRNRPFRFFVLLNDRNLFHVFRMAIKVMSSFCGSEPVKSRTSWMIFYNRLRAIICSRADGLDHAIQAKLVFFSVERLGDTVGVENQAIIALERYREVNCKPIKHVPTVNSNDHSR